MYHNRYRAYTESEECKLLLASIKEDDPYKESKKNQIKRWCLAYSELMELWEGRKPLFFILQKVFSDQDCWESTNNIEKIKLNRYMLAKKLLALKTQNGQESVLIRFDRYRIACWCCCEEEIKNLFEELKLTRGDVSVEKMVSRLREGALMVFWSHVISHQEQKLPLNNEHLYVYGFRSAMPERMVEALEFFWDKLQSVDTLSFEQKDNLLMEVALYKTMYHNANAEMIEFAMKHLNPDKYPELLKRDLEQNGGYSTIWTLNSEYFFESGKKLLRFLNSEKLSFSTYIAHINSIFDVIKASSSDNELNSACEDYLSFIWHCESYESHKQSFLHNLTQGLSRSRDLIFDLVSFNKATTIVSEIINALSPSQMEDIKENSESIYEEFIKVRSTSQIAITGEVSALSLDREYLQQEIVALPEGDSVSEIERNNPTSSVEGNSPDLFNTRLSDKASGRGR